MKFAIRLTAADLIRSLRAALHIRGNTRGKRPPVGGGAGS